MIRDSKSFTILLAILVLVVLTIGNVSAADAPEIEWQNMLGGCGDDVGWSIRDTNDGGYILTGYTYSNSTYDVGENHGSSDVWVVKLDSLGTIQWQKVLGGNQTESSNLIQQTSDSGYVLIGYTNSNNSGDVGINHGNNDVWVVKLDPTGTIQWQKVLGGSSFEQGKSIQQTSDDGYILTGFTSSNTSGDVGINHYNGGSDVWVVKLDSDGALQWQKLLGGRYSEGGNSIRQTRDGGYVLTGYTFSNTSGDVGINHGNNDNWVVKLDSDGTIQWQKVLGGYSQDFGKSIQQTSDDGYILTGETASNTSGDVGVNHGYYDVWVVKLDSAGTIQWQKVLGGSNEERGESIQQTSDGGYILTGYTYSNTSGDVGVNHGSIDAWVVKLDSAGTIQWQKVLGGGYEERGESIHQTTDDGYILTGLTASSNNGDVVGETHCGYDVWVVKLASDTVQESSDLEISSGNITITPAIARPSNSVDITVNIMNTGHKDADNVLVQFYAADAYNFKTQVGNDLTVPKIPAGQTATVHAPWTVEEGTFITVLVDPLNSIGEINEENNNATRMSIRIAEIIVRLAEVQTDADIDNLIRYAEDMGAEGISVSFKDDDTGERYYSDPVAQQHLKAIIRKAHNQSIKVYAWIPVFHDNLTHMAKVHENPDWELKDKIRPSYDDELKDFVNPVNLDVRKFQKDNITTILENYHEINGEKGIDGVRLDYCRFVDDWEDWNTTSLEKFHDDTGIDPLTVDPTNHDAWIKWIDWRADQITSFIEEANSVIKTEDPDSDVGVYLLPFSIEKGYYQNLSITGQDYEKIGPLGVKILPMVYWQDYTNQDSFENWTNYIIYNSTKRGGLNTIPVFSITEEIKPSHYWYEYFLSDEYIEKYLARSAQIAQKNGIDEISLFYRNKWEEREKTRIQNALSFRPEYNLLRPSPYTRPYTFDEAPPYTDFDIFSNWEIAPVYGHIFASFQFGFEAGPGGYIGTQIIENDKKAFFSIWDSGDEMTAQPAVPSLDNCVRFGNEGSGVSCNITYTWQQGRDYKLRVVKIGFDETGDIWKGSITDTVTNEETLIGYIHVDNSNNYQGYGGLTNNPMNFLEYFSGMESYLNQPHARVKWTGPFANYGSYIADQAYASYYTTETLHQNVYSPGYPETILEAGENIELQTPDGTPLWSEKIMVSIAECPVDLKITDFLGRTITKTTNQIPSASYKEFDLNSDGDPDDMISIEGFDDGDYTVEVIPESDADPTETYSLSVSNGHKTLVLAKDVKIQDDIKKTYPIEISESELKLRPLPSLVASFNGTPTSGTSPLTVQFNDTSTGGPTGWAWFFGDEDYRGPWTLVNGSPGWEEREYHRTVAMPDGSIVLMGGFLLHGFKNDTWRSTDSGATWMILNESSGWGARGGHGSVVLRDGSIVLMGGYEGDVNRKNDTWRSTDNGVTWSMVNESCGWSPRFYHSCVALPDGSIVLMGGLAGPDMNDVWRSTDNGVTWTQVNASAGWSARIGHTSVAMPDGSIVLMGGIGKNDTWRSADYGATWTLINASSGWTERSGHTSVVMPDGSIVLTGGSDSSGYRNDTWRSTDNGATWTQVPVSPGWLARKGHTSVAMPDGSIVLMGGVSNDQPFTYEDDTWQFRPAGSSAQNPSHTYTTPGTYQVALQAYNSIGYNTTQKSGYIKVTSAGAMDMVGVFRPLIQKFILKNGTEKTVIPWGLGTDTPVAGDWNGDGLGDVGVYRPSIRQFILKNGTEKTVLPWGLDTDTPVAGDWNGDGMDDVGVYRPSIQKFILKNGTEKTVVAWGLGTDMPVAGDWNGDGMDDVGVYRPSIQKFILKNGTEKTIVAWGLGTDMPVAGDWNGDGFTDVGVYRPSIQKFILKNGTERTVIPWGLSTDIPVSGRWR